MDMYSRFKSIGDEFGAGLYEEPDRSLFYRRALGIRRWFETLPPKKYNGELLYPSGKMPKNGYLNTNSNRGFTVDRNALNNADEELGREFFDSDFMKFRSTVPKVHTVAGDMWTHSMPNYERIAKEGFDSYIGRIEKIEDKDLREGLLHLVEGIRNWRDRSVEYLISENAPKNLIDALKKVPFSPAENIYEAVECWNFVMYLDNCDNIGTIASGLMPYYNGEDITDLLRNLYENLDINDEGYSMQVGIENNPLVVQCLRAAHGLRRPMIEIFVDEDTPAEVWQEAFLLQKSGNTPAFYNKELYFKGFKERFPEIRPEDLNNLCGGGCTEMMISGYSCVGSLDAGINLVYILEKCIKERLTECKSFDEFYDYFLSCIRTESLEVFDRIAESQKLRSSLTPQPMRTLLIDDCIDNGLDYNNGGARYNWSIVNFAGITNCIDSLLVIKKLIFDGKKYTADELISRLNDNDESFLQEVRRIDERFGIDNEEANALSYDFSHRVFEITKERKPYFGLGFLASSIQFQSYAGAGANIGATPDGRHSGEALSDSLTAILGKDTLGPTALLKSVTSLDLSSAIGTPVVNLTIDPKISEDVYVSLIKSYIELGGMQLQITCVSKETLIDAYNDPENHKNLIIRVGGYSEYFVRLTEALKKKVIERTVY